MSALGVAGLDEIATVINEAGAFEVRDVDGGDLPFDYSSANRGPGYLNIKGMCGQPARFEFLAENLSKKIFNEIQAGSVEKFDFINNRKVMRIKVNDFLQPVVGGGWQQTS